jgi:hypothetical protein
MTDNEELCTIECDECGCTFGMPQALAKAAGHSQNIIFYCPYGHSLNFKTAPEKQPEQFLSPGLEEPKKEFKDNVVHLKLIKEDNGPGDNLA